MEVRKQAFNMTMVGVKLLVLRPILPQKKYNNYINNLMIGMDGGSLRMYGSTLTETIKLTKGNSKNYESSTKEADSYLADYIIMRQFQRNLLGVVREHRKKHGMKN